MTKNFALIGAAGYVAPRHLKAIKDTQNELVAALDPFDSVGIIDSFFPNADFFTEPERFDRHLDKRRRADNKAKVDYVSVCSPNYLHDAHIRLALRNQAHAICEKPLVLNPWNLDALEEIEKESGKRIFNILQLRLHPSLIALKQKMDLLPADKMADIDLTYITSRGKWYYYSWKGDVAKSGGVVTNIGIHFFDMLSWIFGEVEDIRVHKLEDNKAAGFLQLKRARVRWLLSLDRNDLPQQSLDQQLSTYRSIRVDGEEIGFSDGFTDLHTESYKQIMAGHGFGIREARNSIQLVHEIRHRQISALKGDYHPLLSKGISS